MVSPDNTYIIRHIGTKEQWESCSGKSSWKQRGHAKCAFNAGAQYSDGDVVYEKTSWGTRVVKFDLQTHYEIIELKHTDPATIEEAFKLIDELDNCMACGVDYINSRLSERVKAFLRKEIKG